MSKLSVGALSQSVGASDKPGPVDKNVPMAIDTAASRYRHILENIPIALYTCDLSGQIQFYNAAAVELWGRTPKAGESWCGALRIFRPDGTPMPQDSCAMAITLREGRPVRGQEIIIERPDGTRRLVMPYPDPLSDSQGNIIGAVNMLVDMTDHKRGEEAQGRLAAIVESSDDAIISKTL